VEPHTRPAADLGKIGRFPASSKKNRNFELKEEFTEGFVMVKRGGENLGAANLLLRLVMGNWDS